MTATIPPTSAPSRRRRSDEKPRTARRRTPEDEGNRIEGRPVDKNMPKTRDGSDTSRPRRTRTDAAKADTATPGTRRTGQARTKTAARTRAAKGAEGTRAVPGTRRAGKTPAKGADKTREARGAADAAKTPAGPGTRRAGKARTAPGAKRADKVRGVPGTRPGEKVRAVPGAKRADKVREAPRTRDVEKGRAGAGRSPVAGAPRARTPFVLLILGLLAGALVSLLLLNTVLAQDAFTLSELQRGNHQLGERRQALQEEIDRESSPEGLHARARSLGMRDVPRPAFIDARTGRVIEGGARPPGVPDDAVAAAGATAVTGVPGAIVPPPRTRRSGGGTR